MTTLGARFRKKVLEKTPMTGTWLFHNNPVWVEIATNKGIDFILVDMEHGQVEQSHIPGLLRASGHGDTAIVIRTQSDDPKVLSRLLDMGVHGLIVPKVETADEARNIVSACRFPPVGTRGLAIGAVRASSYGHDESYRDTADDGIMVGVQIETQAGIDALDPIMSVEGLDLLFVGPNDLTADLGFKRHCEESAALVTSLINRITKAGRSVGTIPYHTNDLDKLRELGINFPVIGSDVSAQVTALEAIANA